MPIPIRESFPTDRPDLMAQVTDDGSITLVRSGTSDAFHSGCGAASETRHVYLENSGVADRLRTGTATRVLEIGLGTGMALLMTADLAARHHAALQYVAFEIDWLAASTVAFLKPHHWVDEGGVADAYLDYRRSLPTLPSEGEYRWQYGTTVEATFRIGSVLQWNVATDACYHAIYYDPFCPDSAPELWTQSSFATMRDLIHPEGRLTTYSCSRRVRDAMEQAGWEVRRVAGPIGGKREVLVATPSGA